MKRRNFLKAAIVAAVIPTLPAVRTPPTEHYYFEDHTFYNGLKLYANEVYHFKGTINIHGNLDLREGELICEPNSNINIKLSLYTTNLGKICGQLFSIPFI